MGFLNMDVGRSGMRRGRRGKDRKIALLERQNAALAERLDGEKERLAREAVMRGEAEMRNGALKAELEGLASDFRGTVEEIREQRRKYAETASALRAFADGISADGIFADDFKRIDRAVGRQGRRRRRSRTARKRRAKAGPGR